MTLIEYRLLLVFEIATLLIGLYVIWNFILKHRNTTMSRLYMAITSLSCFLQNTAYILELTSRSKDSILTAIKVEYIGSTCFTLFYLFLVFNYCNILSKRNLLRIFIPFCLMINGIVLTCDRHPYFYKNPQLKQAGSYFYIDKGGNGPLYYLFPIYALSITAIILIVLTIAYRNPNETKKRKRMMKRLYIAPILPLISLLLRVVGVFQMIDPTPTVSLYAVLIVITFLDRGGAFEIVASAIDQIFEQTEDGIIILDQDLNLLEANKSALKKFPEFQPLLSSIDDKSLSGFCEKYGISFKADTQPFSYEDKYYQVHVTPIINAFANTNGYAATIIDITDLHNSNQELARLKVEADEANAAKTTFLANMSHEIRTPMNAIVGLSELILEESIGRKVYGFAQDIKVASNNLLNIVNDILDVSKMDAGKLKLQPVEYHPKLLFSEISRISQVLAGTQCIEFECNIPEDLPNKLYGDDLRIKQILTNLIGNAIKFTKRGKVTMTVSCEELEDDMIRLSMAIEDTGVGIKKEYLEDIFKSFQQVNGKVNREIEGTGLGLTITKELVRYMDGELLVDSEYGKGSVFTAVIKQKIVDRKILSAENQIDKIRQPFELPNTTLLVVDDNKVNLKVAEAMLSCYKSNVLTANSGIEAIELMQTTNIDLIFMDHMMPIMDGAKATEIIRTECDEAGKKVTIVALTANVLPGVKEMFLEHGFSDFLPKPLEPVPLYDILDNWIDDDQKVYVEASETEAEQISEDVYERLAMRNIDVKLGLSRRSKGVQGYLEILEIFYINGKEKVSYIEELALKGDWENYAIETHALKGTAATIGAMKLSEQAKMHEFAGRDKNASLIKSDYESLLFAYRSILTEVERVLQQEGILRSDKSGSSSLKDIDEKTLWDKIEECYNLMESFKPKEAGETMKNLVNNYNLPEDVAQVLDDCNGKLKVFEDDAVEDLLQELLQKHKGE